MNIYNNTRNTLNFLVITNTLMAMTANSYMIQHNRKLQLNTGLLAMNILMLGALSYSVYQIRKAGSYQAYQQDASNRGLAIRTTLFFSQLFLGTVGNGLTYLQAIDTSPYAMLSAAASITLAAIKAFFDTFPMCGEQNNVNYAPLPAAPRSRESITREDAQIFNSTHRSAHEALPISVP